MYKIKICPKCGSHKVISFMPEMDHCLKCKEHLHHVNFEECHTKCKKVFNGETIHHKNCIYYEGSVSEHYEHEITRVLVEIQTEILKNVDKPNIGKKGCAKRLQQLLDGGNYTEDVEYGDKQ